MLLFGIRTRSPFSRLSMVNKIVILTTSTLLSSSFSRSIIFLILYGLANKMNKPATACPSTCYVAKPITMPINPPKATPAAPPATAPAIPANKPSIPSILTRL